MDTDLHLALCNSISAETQSVVAELMEAGLDSVMDDGLLQEVPILSVAVSLYKIGHSVKERHYVRKLAAFIDALNKGIIDEEKREYYKQAVMDDPKRRDKELEYILILIDRYIHSDKANMLACFYLSYLDGRLSWLEFTKSAEMTDRLLPGDMAELRVGEYKEISVDNVPDSLLRMEGLGLFVSHSQGVTINEIGEAGLNIPDAKIKRYELTAFGRKFLDCLKFE